jgi:hypothetical protein
VRSAGSHANAGFGRAVSPGGLIALSFGVVRAFPKAMNGLHSNTDIGNRSQIYLKSVCLLLPALILWELVCFKCVPILAVISQRAGPLSGNAEGFWNFSMFFVRHGSAVFATIVGVFVLFELFGRAWSRHRRGVVAGVAWLLNLIVICSLASLVTLAVIVFPSLLK